MKHLTRILCLLIAISFMACSKVPAGHAGVKVYLLGGSKGVDHEILGPGRYWIGWNENLFLFPLYQQNYTWTRTPSEGAAGDESITFQTKEGLDVNADVGITYHVDHSKVSELFQKYREPLEEITHKFLRNNIRDAINRYGSKMAVEETYGLGKAALFDSVLAAVRVEVSPEGIVIDKVYLIGTFRLPQAVIDALNAKIAATQMAQQRENEVQTAKAQAQIEVAKASGEAQAQVETAKGNAEATLANARADAEAIRLKKTQITDLTVRMEIAQRWDGVLPTTTTGGAIPFLNVGPSK